MTTIKDILAMPLDQGTGGYDLTVKTVKKRTTVRDFWIQETILTDGKDDILAELKCLKNISVIRNTLIHITVGRRVERDKSNRMVPCLYIDQWADASPLMSEPNMMTEAEEWYAARQNEIKGKCRYGIVCAYVRGYVQENGILPEFSKGRKDDINELVDFIMTGE